MARDARVVFLLHMHQPDYVDPTTKRAEMPWVLLHAASAYLDVATVLDEHPGMRLTVNFVPSLVRQIEQLLAGGEDTWTELARRPMRELTRDERAFLLLRFFSINWGRAIEPRPRYRQLLDKRGRDLPAAQLAQRAAAFSDEELRDLTVLFYLGWLGFAARRGDRELAELEARGRDYSDADLATVLGRLYAAAARVLPLWRQLAARGQVELASSPFYHPIMPLLCDGEAARRARPDLPLPAAFLRAPDDARAQVQRAKELHQRVFGVAPPGMWPPEGSVSPEAAAIYAGESIGWLCTDEGNLWRSLKLAGRSEMARGDLYRAHRFESAAGGVDFLFRDREMSDRIGFAYSHGEARAAVEDLLARARVAAEQSTAPAGDPPLVPIFLDGENAWAAYPGQGEPFLRELFARLSNDAQLKPQSVGGALAESRGRNTLSRLHSGSWIDSDFHIWIGDPVKNRAWELLAEVRAVVVAARTAGTLDAAAFARAEEHLLAAEGSDWFWWFGEPFHSAEDAIFDRLFRAHLVGALAEVPTAQARTLADQLLARPVDPGVRAHGVADGRPFEEPYALIHPRIEESDDGRPPSFYAWHGAGRYEVPRGAAMAEAPLVERLRFGFDRAQLYLRAEVAPARAAEAAEAAFVLELAAGGRRLRLAVPPHEPRWELASDEGAGLVPSGDGRPAAHRSRMPRTGEPRQLVAVELAVPFERLRLAPGTAVQLVARLETGGVTLTRVPQDGALSFTVPDDSFEADHWSA